MGKEGFIKLYRTLLDNSIFNCEPYTKGQAWITILALTNHKEGFITIKNGEMIKIERGECGYSELALSDIFMWSRGKVKRFLKLLESEKMIQQKIVSKHSIIKVLNYEKYQNSATNDTTNGQQTIQQTVQQTDINNNDNNDKNEEEVVEREKLYGEYQNVFLSDSNYNKLLGISLSKKLLEETIDNLSSKIEEGTEQSYKNDCPNAHFIRLKKYIEYRRKHPEKFVDQEEFNPYEVGEYNAN